jgi:Ni,Fe-hydrogenase III large subunit
MSQSALVHRFAVDAIATQEPKRWRDDLLAHLAGGSRVLTFFGRNIGERVVLTAVLEATDGHVRVSRTSVSAQFGYHEMTSECPALHCFERELHEQTGVRIGAHPWLKPIRFEGKDQTAMAGYPFWILEGKEAHEVAVGPIHAGVIEPGSFRFMCHGEQVHHLEIQLGYQHRGVERRLLEGDPRRLTPLVETIAGDTSVAHAWAHAAAIEALAGHAGSRETDAARAVALELERVAMHLAGLSGLSADVGFLQGATTYGRIRTTAINTTMRLCGSRFGRGAIRPGGVRMHSSRALVDEVQANVQRMKADLAIIHARFLSSFGVQHRLRDVGVVTSELARRLGLVGMAARASGVYVDARTRASDGIFAALPLGGVVLEEGDCWARARIRIAEISASLDWICTALALHPSWEERPSPVGALEARQFVVAIVEGWRGEVVHCLETGLTGELVHYKVQDPSLRNWMGLALAVRGNEISDFPICNKSFDLSYCGNDL